MNLRLRSDKRFRILKNGELVPCSLYEWGRWLEQRSNVVEQTRLPGAVLVSTVCLGMDHGFHDRPLWFETMVFGEAAGELDDYQERYETLAEAKAGHARAVEAVKKLLV